MGLELMFASVFKKPNEWPHCSSPRDVARTHASSRSGGRSGRGSVHRAAAFGDAWWAEYLSKRIKRKGEY